MTKSAMQSRFFVFPSVLRTAAFRSLCKFIHCILHILLTFSSHCHHIFLLFQILFSIFREHFVFSACMCMTFCFQILKMHFSMFRDKPIVNLVVLHGYFRRPNRPNRSIWHGLTNLLKRGLQNLAACAMIRPTAGERRRKAQHPPADHIAFARFCGLTQGGQRI